MKHFQKFGILQWDDITHLSIMEYWKNILKCKSINKLLQQIMYNPKSSIISINITAVLNITVV